MMWPCAMNRNIKMRAFFTSLVMGVVVMVMVMVAAAAVDMVVVIEIIRIRVDTWVEMTIRRVPGTRQ